MLKLESIGLGAVQEQFDAELCRVIDNIVDPNTDGKTMRKIVIEMKIKPDPENRERCDFSTQVKTTLAPVRPHESVLYVGVDPSTGETAAEEHVVDQPTLFDRSIESKGEAKVTDIREAM